MVTLGLLLAVVFLLSNLRNGRRGPGYPGNTREGVASRPLGVQC